MPLPLFFIAVAAATGLVGIGKSVKAAVDNHDAQKTNEEANNIVENAKIRLNSARKKCGSDLKELGTTKVRILDSSINDFVRSYEKLKNVNLQNSAGLNEISKLCIDKKDFEELKELGSFATSITSGIASGAIGGAVTAFGAYSAAGALATASTGTAIASLSGAAATNATLAFFGGGAVAAGGLGVAGGAMVLGGLVAGPALAIMGFFVGAKASAAKDEAYSNLAKAKKISEELGAASDLCHDISMKCNLFINLLKKLDSYFKPLILKIDNAIEEHGAEYRLFSQELKKQVAAASSLAKAIKMVLDTPILDKDGNISYESSKILNQIKPEEIIKGNNSTSYSFRELQLSEILDICRYDVVYKKRYTDNLVPCAKFKWEKLISLVNSSYGINCTLEEYKTHIPFVGDRGQLWVSELSYAFGNFIITHQISLIVEDCLLRQVSILREQDINWDKLISKIFSIYGVTIEKWQLLHPGVNKPEDILKRIYSKIFWSGNNKRDYFFTASEFKSLMMK